MSRVKSFNRQTPKGKNQQSNIYILALIDLPYTSLDGISGKEPRFDTSATFDFFSLSFSIFPSIFFFITAYKIFIWYT